MDINILIGDGAQLNLENEEGRSVLTITCYYGHSVFKTLLCNGTLMNLVKSNELCAVVLSSKIEHS